MLKLATASLLVTSITLPVLAQTSAPSREDHSSVAPGAPAAHDTTGSKADDGRDTLLARDRIATDKGGIRASKIVGLAVYNDQHQKIGSIDDLVVGDNRSLNAILSVGSFLGMGSKLVEVPFDHLRFDNTNGSADDRIVMPGVTKESLNEMPAYHYINRG